jgi:hypothetical protein
MNLNQVNEILHETVGELDEGKGVKLDVNYIVSCLNDIVKEIALVKRDLKVGENSMALVGITKMLNILQTVVYSFDEKNAHIGKAVMKISDARNAVGMAVRDFK